MILKLFTCVGYASLMRVRNDIPLCKVAILATVTRDNTKMTEPSKTEITNRNIGGISWKLLIRKTVSIIVSVRAKN